MKKPDRETVTSLEALPNIGKAIAAHLRSIGIKEPQDLIGEDPFSLYEKICLKKQKQVDPCILDVFIAVITFMEGGDAKPWWAYTQDRKKMLQARTS